MITFVAHCPVKPENALAFEAAMTEMAENVRRHEPGAVYYEFSRAVEDPRVSPPTSAKPAAASRHTRAGAPS